MRRKLISYIMICVLVFIPVNSYADLATAIKYVTFDEKEWKQAQQDMLKYYNIANALPKEKGGGKLPMNMYLKRSNGTTKEQNSYYFAYGDPEEGKYYTTLGLHKSLGQVYGTNERLFNPPYGWEFSWNWRKLEDWGQVKEPWENKLCDRHQFDGEELPASSGMKDLEECIQRGLDITYGNMPYDIIKASRDPKEAEKIIDRMEKGEKFSNIVFTKGAKPKAGGKWIDYVHITMLPTTKVWGQGYMYLENGTAMPVPIAPFNALQPDLVPSISSPFQVAGAYNTDVVSADVVVRSSFESDETVDYQWLIKGEKTGKVYQSSEESQCVFGGYGTAEKGDAKIVGRMTSNDKIFSTFSVNFVMPDESVRVIFILNSKNNPKEDQSNNKVEVLIKGLHYEVQEATYTLDYNELSKEIEHPLAGGGISGALRSPTIEDWYWVDEYHMTGSLPIAIAASIGGRTALQDAEVKAKTNEPVDEIGTSVTRSPVIEGRIERPDFHDDPLNGLYHVNGSVDNQMKVFYNKSRGDNLTRQFRYHTDHEVRTGTDSKGNPTYSTCTFCKEHYQTGTTRGKFQPGEDRITIKALIYNGRKNMPHVAARDFLKEIEDNTTDSLTKKIYWESEEYPMSVQRWMKHVTLEEKPKAPKTVEPSETGEIKEDEIPEMEEKATWEPVPGQYERIFTQQNVAEITWEVDESMQQAYASDRKNAKKSKRDKQSYEKVPFATDKELQSYGYPFKSGYYFNPTGRYSVTIHTEIYKDKQEETEEHKALVDSIIESFRYSSTLQYVDKHNNKEQLLLKIDDASGDDTTLYSEDKLLEVDRDYNYVKDFEIPYWEGMGGEIDEIEGKGYTHEFFKEILEGYDESDTIDSKEDYKYREYIVDDHMYRIIEETTLTFIIDPDNSIKKYTYGGMKDGTYHTTAWVEDTDLSAVTRVSGMKLVGIKEETPLDHIPITVKGSMYDDLNN